MTQVWIEPASFRAPALGARGPARTLAPAALVLALSIGLRFVLMPNADVAWLLTMADRMLDGKRLYVDIIEANPPFSVYMYLLPAAIARALGLSGAAVTETLVFLEGFASLWFCAR